jgi:hypothetical protein
MAQSLGCSLDSIAIINSVCNSFNEQGNTERRLAPPSLNGRLAPPRLLLFVFYFILFIYLATSVSAGLTNTS